MAIKRLSCAFDCDESLWLNGNYGTGGRPNSPVVQLFRCLQRLGAYTIVWSAGGREWAKEVCGHCRITPDEIRDKPSLEAIQAGIKEVDFAVDDCEDCGIVTLFV